MLRKIEHVKFPPGILTEVIHAIALSEDVSCDEDKDCVLCFDGMCIQPAVQKNPATKTMIGFRTIPGKKPSISAFFNKFNGDRVAVETYREAAFRETV